MFFVLAFPGRKQLDAGSVQVFLLAAAPVVHQVQVRSILFYILFCKNELYKVVYNC